MKVALYLDEDAQDSDLVQALRLHRVDVIGALEAGMGQRDDDQHLEYVGEQMRRLLKLIATKSPDEMIDQVEFLSNWG